MSKKSTQISDIVSEENETDNNLVQEIIDEIQQQENNDYEEEQEQVFEDNNTLQEQAIQQMHEKMKQEEAIKQQVMQNSTQDMNSNGVVPNNTNQNIGSPISLNKKEDINNNSKLGFVKKYFSLQKLKQFLIVSSIVFLFCLPFVNRSIMKLSTKLCKEEQLNMLGLVIKSLLGGLIFYISNIFI